MEDFAEALGVDVTDLLHAEANHGDGDYLAAYEAAERSRAVREYRDNMSRDGRDWRTGRRY